VDYLSGRMSESKQTSTRWWPLFVIWIVALLVWVIVAFTSDLNRQLLIMKSIGTAVAAGAFSMMWLLALSRLPWRIRLKGLGAAVLLLVMFAGLFRIEGVYGDLVPIIKFRWSSGEDRVSTGVVDVSEQIESSYPQFLGPNRDTRVSGLKLDPDWESHPPELVWKQPIGEAWSAFSVLGNRAITQEQDGADELVVCYELLSGDKRWEHRYPARFDEPLGGIGPRATPTIEEDRVYVLGALGDFTS